MSSQHSYTLKTHKKYTGKNKSKNKNATLRKLRELHRKAGLLCAVFIIIISFTGVSINHINELKLAKLPVKQKWLLDWYQIHQPSQILTFSDSDNHFIISNNLLWINNRLVLTADSSLTMAATTEHYIVLANAHQLYLLSKQGALQETQDITTGLPTPIDRLAIDQNKQLWIVSNGNYFKSDSELISWARQTRPLKLNSQLLQASTRPEHLLLIRSAQLNWQTIIIDLHSGRILGAYSKYFWDLLAIFLIFLAISGIITVIKQKKAKANNKR